MDAFKTERVLKLWDYRVSHQQLLVRGPKGANQSKNLDIAFVGVRYLSIPSTMRGVSIEAANADEVRELQIVLGNLVEPDSIFVMCTGASRHIVVAAAMKIFENELEIFESSLEKF